MRRISIQVREPSQQKETAVTSEHVIVTPGQVITEESGFLRGHGTYIEDGHLVASVAGVVQKVNQLISVRPLKSRYIGEVGDIIVGRISNLGNKRWKVDVNAHQDAVLMLTSINLPGGVQRRRTNQDQLDMRNIFVENDLISAEVQEVRHDGTIWLHARSLRYGKLENGQFLSVSPGSVKRMKQHIVDLPCGVQVILGNNGYIWITRTMPSEWDDSEVDFRLADEYLRKRELHTETEMSMEDRMKIAQVNNAILHLHQKNSIISPSNIMAVLESSNI